MSNNTANSAAAQQPTSSQAQQSSLTKKGRVYHGIAKDNDMAQLAATLSTDSDDELDDRDKAKRRKTRREFFLRRAKGDANAPPPLRMPYPEQSDRERIEKMEAMRDMWKMITLDRANLPSALFATLHAHHDLVNCATFSDDISLLAAGFEDCRIRVWSLNAESPLTRLKSAAELAKLNPEDENAAALSFEEPSDCYHLSTNASVALCLAFSPCKRLLLAGCQDGSLRMFSLYMWQLVCQYHGHVGPIWDVDFSPLGYYFATAGYDRTARLWSTGSIAPLRIFTGHGDDVTCVKFHPNGQYIVTGSWDRSIRLYDAALGQCMRHYQTLHAEPIKSVNFSRCGRYIAATDEESTLWLLDIQEPPKPVIKLVPQVAHVDNLETPIRLRGATGAEFSRDNNIIAIADLNGMLHMWDVAGIFEAYAANDYQTLQTSSSHEFYLQTLYTKKTPIFRTLFSRRNILVACGPYEKAEKVTSSATPPVD